MVKGTMGEGRRRRGLQGREDVHWLVVGVHGRWAVMLTVMGLKRCERLSGFIKERGKVESQ
eukprot:162751-Hanusia_phi.AAC.2